jgi:hypothetical protein
MSDEPKKQSKRWIGWALLALLVLYPLSMGPAFWWATAEGPFFFFERWKTLDTFYAPLDWLNRFDWTRDAMHWYLEKFSDWRPWD